MKIKCRDCETKFVPKHFNSKLCEECKTRLKKWRQKEYKNAWRESKKPKIEEKVCLNCKKTFTPNIRNNVEHCSYRCTKETVKKRAREETKNRQMKLPLKECKQCKKTFKPSKDDKRHEVCSYECRNEFAKASSKKKTKVRQQKIRPRICHASNCRKVFMPDRYDINSKQMQKYCNIKCLQNRPERRLSKNVSNQLRKSLRANKVSKTNRTFGILNFSRDELKKHLESQFTDGMSWDNIGSWHIDHIRPVASFNFDSTDHPEFKKCWSLDNLQPLWAEDNLSKGDTWDGIINA